jgi:predicted nucleic acid-binding protein
VIVVDASAMTELLLQTPLGLRVEARLFRDGDDFHAPHLLDVEVVQALRRLARAGDVAARRAEEANQSRLPQRCAGAALAAPSLHATDVRL